MFVVGLDDARKVVDALSNAGVVIDAGSRFKSVQAKTFIGKSLL